MKKRSKLLVLIFLVGVLFYYKDDIYKYTYSLINNGNSESYDINNIPQYSGNSYVIINDNIPYFDEEDYSTSSFEKYSDLDSGKQSWS